MSSTDAVCGQVSDVATLPHSATVEVVLCDQMGLGLRMTSEGAAPLGANSREKYRNVYFSDITFTY